MRPRTLVIAVLHALADMEHGPGPKDIYMDPRHGLRVRIA